MFGSKSKGGHKYKGNVLIVDSIEQSRNSLVKILISENYRVDVASSYEQSKNFLKRESFDIALVEPRLNLEDSSSLDGIRLVKLIRNTQQSTRVIILTAFATLDLARETLEYNNALDFVDKKEHPGHIVAAIEKALSKPVPSNDFPALTIVEQEVLEMIVKGKTDREIAKELDRTDKIIKKHVFNILAKLGAKSRVQVAVIAERYHLTAETNNKKTINNISKSSESKEKIAKFPSGDINNHTTNTENVISRTWTEIEGPKHSNQFRYLLQKAIDQYAKTQKRGFADILAEMDDQLGYGRKSQTIQHWLNESVVPNSAEVEYFAKKITSETDLDFEWIKKFYDAAGYEVPSTIITKLTKPEGLSESNVIVSNNVMIGKSQITINSYPNDQPADIFISYARTDVDVVQSIYNSLQDKNHHPWMDVHSIKGGENWLRAIYKAIDECAIFLAVLSNSSVSRRGIIQRELKKALDRWEGMLPDDIYIIPVRIDDCPIPDLLKHIQVLDWKNGKGEDKLLEAIRVGLARRKDE